MSPWISLRDNLQDPPDILWENTWFPVDLPFNQSSELLHGVWSAWSFDVGKRMSQERSEHGRGRCEKPNMAISSA